MEASEREKMITQVMQEGEIKYRLPSEPTVDDLMPFSKVRLKKSRMKKKFRKYWYRYVSDDIRKEFCAQAMVAPIRRALTYDSFARKLFMVEPLPECCEIKIDRGVHISTS